MLNFYRGNPLLRIAVMIGIAAWCVGICAGQSLKLQIQAPSKATSGQDFTFRVQVSMASGTPSANTSGALTITSDDTSADAKLPSGVTFSANCGSATNCIDITNGGGGVFTASLVTGGTRAITVSDSAGDVANASISIGPAAIVICPPSFSPNACVSKSNTGSPSFTAIMGQPFPITLVAIEGDSNHSTDTAFQGHVNFGSNLACNLGSNVTPISPKFTQGMATATATMTSPGLQTLTATDTADSLAPATALVTVEVPSGSAGTAPASFPQYFTGTSFVKPPLLKGTNNASAIPVGDWSGTATGEAVALCQLSPGGTNAHNCQVQSGETIIVMTSVQHNATFTFNVADDGMVKGDGTILYIPVVSGSLTGGTSQIGIGTRHFTFEGQLTGLPSQSPSSGGSAPPQQPGCIPPKGNYILERDKNYETGPIQLNFPCGGSGTFTLAETSSPSGATPSPNAATSVTGTLTPDGSLYDVCVPMLGVAMMEQPISWDDSSQELTLPFLLFGPSGSSGAYTTFELPHLAGSIAPRPHYQLTITKVNVEGDPIPVANGQNASEMTLYAPFGNTPVDVKMDPTGRFYIFEQSSKPGFNEPSNWPLYNNTWQAKQDAGSSD